MRKERGVFEYCFYGVPEVTVAAYIAFTLRPWRLRIGSPLTMEPIVYRCISRNQFIAEKSIDAK